MDTETIKLLMQGGCLALVMWLVFYMFRYGIPRMVAMIEAQQAQFNVQLDKHRDQLDTSRADFLKALDTARTDFNKTNDANRQEYITAILSQRREFMEELAAHRQENQRLTDQYRADLKEDRAVLTKSLDEFTRALTQHNATFHPAGH